MAEEPGASGALEMSKPHHDSGQIDCVTLPDSKQIRERINKIVADAYNEMTSHIKPGEFLLEKPIMRTARRLGKIKKPDVQPTEPTQEMNINETVQDLPPPSSVSQINLPPLIDFSQPDLPPLSHFSQPDGTHQPVSERPEDAAYVDDENEGSESDNDDHDDPAIQAEMQQELAGLTNPSPDDGASQLSSDFSDEGEVASNQDEETPIREEIRWTEKFVNVYGKPIAAYEYFGDEWSDMVTKLDRTGPIAQPDFCATELQPWQLTGIAKLQYLATGPFSGGILGDEQGLGKTLTNLAVLVDDAMSNAKSPRPVPGFNLIVTTKTCVPQWLDEIKHHFGPEVASRSFFLNDPKMTANELLDGNYWFVLCTYQYVMSRYRSFMKNLQFYRVVQYYGLEYTLKEMRASDIQDLGQRHINSLFSQVYRLLDIPIRHLVLDEAQYVKNTMAITHKAMKALYYNRVFLLSGTFIPNRWHDVFGLVDLIRGHPYATRAQFITSFAAKNQNNNYGDPSRSKANRLIKFLQAITVSRPASLLNLKGLSVKRHDLILDKDAEESVATMTQQFVEAVSRLRRDALGGFSHEDDKNSRAMIFAMKAQQYCANVTMVVGQTISAEDHIDHQTRSLLDDFHAQQSYGNTPDELQKAFTAKVKKWSRDIVERNKLLVKAG